MRWVHSVPCSPSLRTAAPTPRLARVAVPSTGGSSCSSPRSVPPGSRRARACSPRARRTACRPGPAATRRQHLPAVVDTKLASGVIVPTAPWLIAENAKPGTLNWICNHVQPDHALEGFASQVSAVPGDDVAALRQHHGPRRPGAGVPDGLLPGPRGPSRRADGLRRRPSPSPPRSSPPASARCRCPWTPTMTLNITKDWLPGLLPLEAGRQRRRGAVRAAHHPRRRLHGVLRAPEQRDDLAGLQPLGQLQPLLRPRARAGSRTSPAAPGSCPSTGPTPRPGPRARPTSSATSCRCCSTSRASGLDLTYWTDVDLHARPQLLANHRCLFSLATTSTGPSPCARPPPRPTPTASTWPSSAPTPATARSGWSRPRSGPTAWRSATRTPPRTPWPRSSPRSPRSTGTRLR